MGDAPLQTEQPNRCRMGCIAAIVFVGVAQLDQAAQLGFPVGRQCTTGAGDQKHDGVGASFSEVGDLIMDCAWISKGQMTVSPC